MRIDFTQLERSETDTKYNKILQHAAPKAQKSVKGDGYRLDISGTVMDNAAFDISGSKGIGKRSQGKTLEESLQDVDNYDPQTMHNYMAVMSNCMSARDFSELQKEGYSIGQMEPQEAVTNLDRIKVTLAKAGVNVAGYTDTVDNDTVRKITGSAGEANRLTSQIKEALESADLPSTADNVSSAEKAVSTASEISGLSDNTIRYMIDNALEPTIENVYEAQFKGGSGAIRQGGYYTDNADGSYLQKKADIQDISQITTQIDEIINEAGYEADEAMRGDAAWLIEKGLPLTKENLRLYEDIKGISFPVDSETLLTEIAQAISRGQKASDAYLIKNYNAVKAARQLEETRLSMTTEANRKLNESNFSIDTDAIRDNLEALKNKEQVYYRVLFGGSTDSGRSVEELSGLYKETLQKVDEIRSMPAALMGHFSSAEAFTVNDVYEAGISLQNKMDAAVGTYETVGTQVRADLGDSIQKAFANVDDILSSLDLEKTSDNRRAVRILGYNGMEMTGVNIDRVKAVDIEVRTLINKMNPANTAALIKNKINPLDTDIHSLNRTIDSLNDSEGLNSSVKKTDKFAEYLIRMENSGEITEEERTSYIGIYRLFDKIEKSDGAIIGSLVDAGKELSLRNLLSEVRTRKKGGVDITVNDDFGGMDISDKGTARIDAQIDMAFKRVYLEGAAAEISESLDPGLMKKAGVNEDTTLETLADIVKNGQGEAADTAAERYTELAHEMELAAKADTTVYEALINYSQPVTTDNVNALASIFENRNALFNDIVRLDSRDDDNDLAAEAEHVIDNMDSAEDTAKAYDRLIKTAAGVLDNALDNVTGRIDVQAIQSANKRLTLIKKLSNEENYYIPVEIDGELTAVNLKFIRGTGRNSANITMESKYLGRLEASLTLKDGRINGILSASFEEGAELMNSVAEKYTEALSAEGLTGGNINSVRVRGLNINKIAGSDVKGSKDADDTTKLYKAAKAFIKTVRELAQ